jgi:hypothetical protein
MTVVSEIERRIIDVIAVGGGKDAIYGRTT